MASTHTNCQLLLAGGKVNYDIGPGNKYVSLSVTWPDGKDDEVNRAKFTLSHANGSSYLYIYTTEFTLISISDVV